MELNIDPDFSEWFGYWIGDGDKSLKRGTFGVAGQSIEIQKLNIKILLEYFHLSKERLRLEITSSRKDSDLTIKKEYSNLLGIAESQVKSIFRNPSANRDCLRVFVYSLNTLRDFLFEVEKIKNVILVSNENIMSRFVNGIFAAEGSIKKKGKLVRMLMIDKNEVDFVKKVMDKLGIASTMNFQKISGGWELSIHSYDNLLRFKEIGGFGRFIEKNSILNERMEHYEKKLPWTERYRRLCSLFSELDRLTNRIVVEKFGMKYHAAKFMMANFARKGLLDVDKSNKTHIYTLNKLNGIKMIATPREQQGKIARLLASKLTLAARGDFYSKEDHSKELLADYKKKLEEVRKDSANSQAHSPR